MSKRKRRFTNATYENWIKQARGLGVGANYRPWYTIHDVSSYGLCHRIQGTWTTNREHHLMSNLERYWFLVFDWTANVIDIREQFPLLPLRETIAIARECGVRHPYERRGGSNQAIVLTTDFVLTVAGDPKPKTEARTVKYAKSLNSERVIEKFEVERRYWSRRNVDWQIVTERDLPRTLARNLDVIRTRSNLAHRLDLPPERLYTIAQTLTENVVGTDEALRTITSRCDTTFGLPVGASLTLAYFLIANRCWHVDLYVPIDPGRCLRIVCHDLDGIRPQ